MNLDVKEAFCQKRNININMFSITIFPTQKYVITHSNPLLLSFYYILLLIYAVQLKPVEPLKNNFSLKIRLELKITNFLITNLQIFCDSIFTKF